MNFRKCFFVWQSPIQFFLLISDVIKDWLGLHKSNIEIEMFQAAEFQPLGKIIQICQNSQYISNTTQSVEQKEKRECSNVMPPMGVWPLRTVS